MFGNATFLFVLQLVLHYLYASSLSWLITVIIPQKLASPNVYLPCQTGVSDMRISKCIFLGIEETIFQDKTGCS